MGTLQNIEDGQLVILESTTRVGRSRDCRVIIPLEFVSAQHALVHWTGSTWEVRDLGSTNGTVVDGLRLGSGESRALTLGTTLAFGRPKEQWRLIDDCPPRVLVLAEDGMALVVEGEMLALPSPDNPTATIFRDPEGCWKLERDDIALRLTPGGPFEVDGRVYRLSCPEVLPPTSTAEVRREIREAHLHFRVSRDEEHVEIQLQHPAMTAPLPLPVRNHNYLLLLLARRRADVEERDVPESSRGWTYKDQLLRSLRVTVNQLNIDIFRIRKQFEALSLSDAHQVIEWRPRTRELRLGVARLSFESL